MNPQQPLVSPDAELDSDLRVLISSLHGSTRLVTAIPATNPTPDAAVSSSRQEAQPASPMTEMAARVRLQVNQLANERQLKAAAAVMPVASIGEVVKRIVSSPVPLAVSADYPPSSPMARACIGNNYGAIREIVNCAWANQSIVIGKLIANWNCNLLRTVVVGLAKRGTDKLDKATANVALKTLAGVSIMLRCKIVNADTNLAFRCSDQVFQQIRHGMLNAGAANERGSASTMGVHIGGRLRLKSSVNNV